MKLVSAIILSLSLPIAANAADVAHDVMLRLWPAEGRVEAVDRLSLPAAGPRVLRLSSNLTITRLEVNGNPVPASGAHGAWRLPGGATEVVAHYSGTLAPLAENGGDIGIDAPASGPEGAFLPAWGRWLPDLGGSGRIDYRITVEVPAPFVAVATGSLIAEERGAETYRATFAARDAAELPTLFAGPYRIVEAKSGDGPLLRAYLHPEHAEDLATGHLDLSRDLIQRFAAEIGPYPFDAFHIVSAPLPVGLGFPGMTYIGRRILPLPFVRSQSLAHEILHNWWGNGVAPDYARGNWSEGLTTYMADYALAPPERQRLMRLDWLRDYAALPAERDQPAISFRSKQHDASQVIGYNKVAFFFHMLREEAGSAAFTAAIRRFWTENRMGVAGWPDLRRAFEAETGRDLGWFFDQWLARPGAPALTLGMAAARPVGDGWRVDLEVSATGDYALWAPVTVETDAGARSFRLWIEHGAGSGSLTLRERPLAVSVDPEADLFRHLASGEAVATLRDVTLAAGAGLVVAADGEAAEAARSLAARLLDQPGRPLAAADAISHDGPLLVAGLAEPLAALLPRLGLDRHAEGPSPAGTARVWVAARRLGAVMIIAAADAAALAALQRPLPHYGRQSWLVFDGAKALDKGVWPPTASALRRRL